VRRIVEQGEQKAREILAQNLDGLHVVQRRLLEYETLSGDEVQALLRGEKIRQASAMPTSRSRAPRCRPPAPRCSARPASIRGRSLVPKAAGSGCTETTDTIVPSPAERRGFSVAGGWITRRYLLPRGLLRGPRQSG
jgi:hypothetical protein